MSDNEEDLPKQPSIMGRPRAAIDWDQVEKLCLIQCSMDEIAGVFGCHPDTLNNQAKKLYGKTFSEYASEKWAAGRASLRRKQWQAAMAGNVRMLIWLGQQVLGQNKEPEAISSEGFKVIITDFTKKEGT